MLKAHFGLLPCDLKIVKYVTRIITCPPKSHVLNTTTPFDFFSPIFNSLISIPTVDKISPFGPELA